jgi:predicted permease
MGSLFADFRYATRQLAKRPGFTLVALLIIGLGVGANSAVFSVVDAVLLKPLPVESPDELVEIYSAEESESFPATLSYPDYVAIKARDDLFSGVIAYTAHFFGLSSAGRSEAVFGELVSGNYFGVLGVRPTIGRGFRADEDDLPGAAPVVVISHGLWKRRFAADPGIIGRTIALSGRPFEVVGVMPAEFTGMYVGVAPEAWAPLTSEPYLAPGSGRLESRSERWLFAKGRLRRGVSPAQAQAGIDVLAGQLAGAYPDSNRRLKFRLIPTSDVRLHPEVDRVLTPVATILMTVVGLVLLIACTNLAGLLLARAVSRRKEMAIRLAIGAKRGRLVRLLLTESMVLAILGGVLGLLMALWTASSLVSLQPPGPLRLSLDLGVGVNVLAFTALITILTGFLFGLAPALQATRPDVVPALKDEVTSLRPAGGGLAVRNGLVVLQVAVSLVLLIGAGLFLRSLTKAQHIDPGFERRHAAILTLAADLTDYSRQDGEQFFHRLRERLASLPGVEAVAIASHLPLGYTISTAPVYVEGADYAPDAAPVVDITTISSGYFEALRIPLIRGRDFGWQDNRSAPPAVILSEAAARRFWPGENPIGKRLRLHGANHPPRTVVGVARDAKVRTLGEAPRPLLYRPLTQNYVSWVSFVVRTEHAPESILPLLRREVLALDESMPIMEAKTMSEHLGFMLFAPRMGGILLAVFGGLAVLLALTGLYGVVAFAASQRTREVGIRVALGASSTDVVVLIMRQSAALVAAGAAIGLVTAGLATRPLGSLLYGIRPLDPLTFVGVTLLLAAVALAASLVPAIRAVRVDPITALRSE